MCYFMSYNSIYLACYNHAILYSAVYCQEHIVNYNDGERTKEEGM